MLRAVLAWQTVVAALFGLALGGGLAVWISTQRERRWVRQQLEVEARVRRMLVPVLERRADALRIPTAERGVDASSPIDVALALSRAIGHVEESSELPFGDTVDVSLDDVRRSLSEKTPRRA